MSDRRVTLIVSDLHVGGGTEDRGDDHVYDGEQFVRFLRASRESDSGRKGLLELFINGDFLEFAQVKQAAFSHPSDEYWCSESESLEKLNEIIKGHPSIFKELFEFQQPGNIVSIAAGNHDVDLWWPAVQTRLREVSGPNLAFELGQEWVGRYGDRLQIGHGHMDDRANRFKHWDKPIRELPGEADRLEMCPGTLFMVKFVNMLEREYPFADNLLPVTKLVSVLLREDKSAFAMVGWMFTKLVLGSPISTLSASVEDSHGDRLLARVRTDENLQNEIFAELQGCNLMPIKSAAEFAEIKPSQLASIMLTLLGRVDFDDWARLFPFPELPMTLGEDAGTLSALAQSNSFDGKMLLRSAAQRRMNETDALVIVMGHTHQPDCLDFEGGGKYYNPGCWTRYLEMSPGQKITLDELRDEEQYPYELNFVKVYETDDHGILHSEMICFERAEGKHRLRLQ